MIVSEARREANRRNAQRSTGPKTDQGKERSRRNALTHGLSAEVVHLPEDAPLAAPIDPAIDWPGFLAEQVGVLTSKLGRCEALDTRQRGRVAYRAEHHWDDDRRLEAEFLGSGIARDPAGVARRLRRSPQGCDWMAGRWALLARAADRDGVWTPEQRSIALDLLGRPIEFRGDDPAEEIDDEGRALPGLGLADLARREIASLRALAAQLARGDALERSWARAEPDESDDPALRRLRRHESDLHRRLRWTVAQLAKAQPAPPAPAAAPPPPAPIPPARPRLEPPRGPLGGLDLDFDFDPFKSFDDLMARAEAHIAAGDLREAQAALAASPARPDPKLAREKARQAARRDKRDRR